jgi:hypothetical protein
MTPQKTCMVGKWHRSYPEDFWRGNRTSDWPADGQTVAIYHIHTGYDICLHEATPDDEYIGHTLSSERGFLGDDDVLWSEDLSFATNREPIPEEYLEDFHNALDNPKFPHPVGPSGNPEAIKVREYIELGPVPFDEAAVQLGDPYYEAAATVQCKAYAKQLERLHPTATLGIKWFTHDFGRYPEVVVYYDPNDEVQTNLAFEIEGDLPAAWDEIARQSIAATSTLDPCEKAFDAEQARLQDEDGACDDGRAET